MKATRVLILELQVHVSEWANLQIWTLSKED